MQIMKTTTQTEADEYFETMCKKSRTPKHPKEQLYTVAFTQVKVVAQRAWDKSAQDVLRGVQSCGGMMAVTVYDENGKGVARWP